LIRLRRGDWALRAVKFVLQKSISKGHLFQVDRRQPKWASRPANSLDASRLAIGLQGILDGEVGDAELLRGLSLWNRLAERSRISWRGVSSD
jgi:hypothetical protein